MVCRRYETMPPAPDILRTGISFPGLRISCPMHRISSPVHHISWPLPWVFVSVVFHVPADLLKGRKPSGPRLSDALILLRVDLPLI